MARQMYKALKQVLLVSQEDSASGRAHAYHVQSPEFDLQHCKATQSAESGTNEKKKICLNHESN